jgi:hypothetical protein
MISLWPSPPTDTFPLLQELLNDVPANVTDATDGEVRIQYPDMSCCVCNTWGYLSSTSTSFRVMTHEYHPLLSELQVWTSSLSTTLQCHAYEVARQPGGRYLR